jgi:hypothetical protein
MDERPLPTAEAFDRAFEAAAESPWLREVINDLPPEVDPFSFVTLDGLYEIVDRLALPPDGMLVEPSQCWPSAGASSSSRNAPPDRSDPRDIRCAAWTIATLVVPACS